MKKFILAFAAVCVGVSVFAAIPDGYYSSVDGKKGDAITAALYSKITNHTDVDYDGLYDVYPTSDVVPGTNEVWDIYSTCTFHHGSKTCGSYKTVCNCYNREHSVPQSWFNEAKPMKSDAFHVYPTDGKVNGQRSNYPYGECAGGESLGGHALGRLGTSTFSGYGGKVFEPDDEYKGDLARSYFYMVSCYRNRNFTQSTGASAVFTYSSNTAGLTSYAINLFLKWHRQDPVSQKEIDRNNAIYAKQKNRNPFIDYPCLAEYIWGEYKGQTLNLATLMSTSDYAYAESDGTGCNCATEIPTLLTPKYGVVVPLGGASLDETVQTKVRVLGSQLTQPVSVAVSGADADCFSVAVSSLTAEQVNSGVDLIVSYSPIRLGKHTTTLSFSSSELSVTTDITLTGESQTELVQPKSGDIISLVSYGVGTPSSQTVNIKTTNLSSDIYVYPASEPEELRIEPEDGYFSFDEANSGTTITITFTPKALGTITEPLVVYPLAGDFVQPSISIVASCVFDVMDPTDITTSSATLHWTNAGTNNYLVDVFTLVDEERVHLAGYPRVENYTFHTVTGLLPDTEYGFTVKPDNTNESEPRMFLTSDGTDLPSVSVDEVAPKFIRPDGHLFIRHRNNIYNAHGTLLSTSSLSPLTLR